MINSAIPSLQDICLHTVRKKLVELKFSDLIWNVGDFQRLDDKFVDILLAVSPRSNRIHASNIILFSGCHFTELCLLESFNLHAIDINEYLADPIFASFPSINSFSLKNVYLTDYGISHIAMNMAHLSKISFCGCRGFTVDGLACLDRLHNIDCLDIDDCAVEINEWPLLNQKFISTLRIGGNVVAGAAIKRILEISGSSLRCLSIWGINLTDFTDNDSFLKISAIIDLDIRWVLSIPSFFQDLFQLCDHLKTLDCGHTALSDDFTHQLCHAHELQSLSLNSTRISYASLSPLLQLTNLDYLNLTSTNISDNEFIWSFAGLVSLRTLLLKSCILNISAAHDAHLLKYLQQDRQGDVEGGDPAVFADEHAQSFVEGNRSPTLRSFFPLSLRVLDLGSASLGCTRMLAASITALTGMRALDLSGLLMSDGRWAAVLTNKRKLKSLNVAGSNIPTAALAGAIESARLSLENLNFSETSLTPRSLSRNCTFPKLHALEISTSFQSSSDLERWRNKMFPLIDWTHAAGDRDDHIPVTAVGRASCPREGQANDTQFAVSTKEKGTSKGRTAATGTDKGEVGARCATDSARLSKTSVGGGRPVLLTPERLGTGKLAVHDDITCAEESYSDRVGVSVAQLLAVAELPISKFRPPGFVHVPGLSCSTVVELPLNGDEFEQDIAAALGHLQHLKAGFESMVGACEGAQSLASRSTQSDS